MSSPYQQTPPEDDDGQLGADVIGYLGLAAAAVGVLALVAMAIVCIVMAVNYYG
ncbi:hypothetical protein ABFT23_02865 [Nocardioides sp. C4-1]|uniref:hypothetical protein n=1 Tax=Nocardioides sp. C4-1 TaxID=3151851 RepID=UPI003267289E